jgi:hypothetical protein
VAKNTKKSQGQWDKEDPPGDLEKQGHSHHHQEEVRPIYHLPRSRHKQQCYHACQRKEEVKRKESVIQWEEGHKAHKIAQITNQAMRDTCKNYGLIANLAISTHLSTHHVLGKTPMGVYFAHFTNKQFHDQPTKKIIPAAASTVLGFGLKFIPIPKNPSIRITSTKPSSNLAMIFT